MKLTPEERERRRYARELALMKTLPGGGRGGVFWPDGMTGHEVKEALRRGTLNLRPGAEIGSLATVIAGCTCASFARNDYRPGYVLIDKACRWHGDNKEPRGEE